MLFGLETDSGSEIVWYIVPDAFEEVPSARIYGRGELLLTLEANERRSALVEAGRHPTGQCGFRLSDTMLPGLKTVRDLEIRDAASDILIYRRRRPDDTQKRILHIYQELFPPRAITNQLESRFQYGASRIELHGHETITQLFHINDIRSIFFSGRILIQNYEQWIDDKFSKIIFVADPYVAFAERLLILSKISQVGRPALIVGERDALLLKPAIEFARELNIAEPRALRSALRRLPDEIAPAFVDPLTRLLTTSSPTELPRTGSLAKSLDFLASCAIVGVGGDETLYADTIAELAGLEHAMIPIPPRFAGLNELAETLRSHARIEHLIGKDLELFEATKSAFSKAR